MPPKSHEKNRRPIYRTAPGANVIQALVNQWRVNGMNTATQSHVYNDNVA